MFLRRLAVTARFGLRDLPKKALLPVVFVNKEKKSIGLALQNLKLAYLTIPVKGIL